MISPEPEPDVIHLVDDDDSFRKAVTRVLQTAGYEVRAYRSAGDFALSATGARRRGCLLLDVRMPGPSGLELQEALARNGDTLPIIFITAHADVPSSVQAFKGGAVDFLTKPAKRDVLLGAVRNALAHAARLHVTEDRRLDLEQRQEKLTDREQKVFALVVTGKLNKEIAAELGMAERTVKAHRAQVMRKMQAESFAELVRIADELDLDPR